MKNYKIFFCAIPKLKSNLNQWFPPQIILTTGQQPKFPTIDPKRREDRTHKQVFISLARDIHCHSSEWLSGFAVAKNHLGKCVKSTDSWIRPYPWRF